MFHLSDISGMSSTIIETVSIEVDDFSESFLTCGTCLCVYDAAAHAPKLLPCSHTVCLSCVKNLLEEAAAAQSNGHSSQTCCPVCGTAFAVPQAGAVALPASFVVNQLLDLMAAGRRRDFVPKCAQHLSTELLFCETCDTVFCVECDTGGAGVHGAAGATASAAHTVVPFAVAIRRVSEILQYKAAQCARNLDEAAAAVQLEMQRLDEAAERCIEAVGSAFAELQVAIENRHHDVATNVKTVCEEKTRVLQEQLSIMNLERERVDAECNGLPPDVRGITARIGKLNELLDASSSLAEPRENSYIAFNHAGILDLQDAIGRFGTVCTSETFPALCTISAPVHPVSVHIRAKAVLTTYNRSGHRQTSGNDPVVAILKTEAGEQVSLVISSLGDGTYEIHFTPVNACVHFLTVSVFDRVVPAAAPLSFTVCGFHEPVATFGSLHQPVAVGLDNSLLYVLDTGNSRIAVYNVEAEIPGGLHFIMCDSLKQRGATGMSLYYGSADVQSSLIVTNWRTRQVAEISLSGDLMRSFTCEAFLEPTSVAVGLDRTIFVADNAARCIFVFAQSGQLLHKFGTRGEQPGQLGLVTCLYAVPKAKELLVCDHRVQAFDYAGNFLYSLPSGDSVGRGQYGGVTIDHRGYYLASRSERGRAIIQVFNSERQWIFSVVSGPSTKMRRPSGLVVDDKGYVYVADLGNDCVRKFRYV